MVHRYWFYTNSLLQAVKNRRSLHATATTVVSHGHCNAMVTPSVRTTVMRPANVVRASTYMVRLFCEEYLRALQWRHNGRNGAPDHQPPDCLLNRLFRRRSKKTSKLRVTGLCEGNSPVAGEFPAQRASNAENVSIWWRHHGGWLLSMIRLCLTLVSRAIFVLPRCVTVFTPQMHI